MSNFFNQLKNFTQKLFKNDANKTQTKQTQQQLNIRLPKTSTSHPFKNNQAFMAYVYSAPYQYKSFHIPKRNGQGKRVIAQPTAELKSLQREILSQIAPHLPIHACAYAYVKNKSIKDNALLHIDSNYILKLDFKNFFHSIRPAMLINQLRKHEINITEFDQNLMSFLFFWREEQGSPLKLSIGAPSSPLLSNFVMYHFDEKLHQLCQQNACVYSRYADDITISSKFQFHDLNFPERIQKLLHEEFDGKIKLNPAKTKYISSGHRRSITGITLTNQGKITVGSKQKRLLSSRIHHFKLNKITDQKDILSLKGQLAFAFYIYPDLKEQFIRKYGNSTIQTLMTYQIQS